MEPTPFLMFIHITLFWTWLPYQTVLTLTKKSTLCHDIRFFLTLRASQMYLIDQWHKSEVVAFRPAMCCVVDTC